ncbi:MAG: hypothetical protein PF487_08345 [Bacteroidales bacterium]|jgi:hypothetical protein|nr:hypothetical protein [Bacteroidales bacterium]
MIKKAIHRVVKVTLPELMDKLKYPTCRKAKIKQLLKNFNEEIERLRIIIEEKSNNFNFLTAKSFSDFEEHLKPESEQLRLYSAKKRYIMPYKLSELSDNGNVMSLKEFIECVEGGGFIDYDGSGNYLKDGKKLI